MPTINDPAHVTLGTSDTEIVAELGASVDPKRVFLIVTNTDTVQRTFRIHRYDADGAETAAQANAIFYDRPIAPNSEEIVEVSVTLTSGWKISGQADLGSVVIVHVDDVQVQS